MQGLIAHMVSYVNFCIHNELHHDHQQHNNRYAQTEDLWKLEISVARGLSFEIIFFVYKGEMNSFFSVFTFSSHGCERLERKPRVLHAPGSHAREWNS